MEVGTRADVEDASVNVASLGRRHGSNVEDRDVAVPANIGAHRRGPDRALASALRMEGLEASATVRISTEIATASPGTAMASQRRAGAALRGDLGARIAPWRRRSGRT